MKEKLTFIAAGAGTGKTYRLVQEVKKAITGGTRPEGVMATTFSRASANELKERLASVFHADGLHDAALALEGGWISTVHGICFQILSRFAFEAGVSPDIRILDDSEATLLLDRSVDEVVDEDVRQELYAVGGRLGQRNTQTWEWSWRRDVKTIVGSARENDIGFDRLPGMGKASWREMAAAMPAPSAEDLDGLFERRAKDALDAMAVSTKKNTGAYRNLLRTALRGLQAPGFQWSEWGKLAKTAPEVKFKEEAGRVAEVALRAGEHPQLHRDLARYLDLLFGVAAKVGDRFSARKRERGAADFADLEKDTLDLLRTNADVRDALRDEIEILLVDEFQDTSPIQLALFAELGRLADKVIWVGDVKQSIYGFRGADPELVFRAVSGAGRSDNLETSWRSVPDLVDLSNRLFAPAFEARLGIPAAKTDLEAHRTAREGAVASVDVASISSGDFYKNGNPKPLGWRRPKVIADAVEELLGREGELVGIKSSISNEDPLGEFRPVRSGDIAVLTRSGAAAVSIAEALRSRGIDVALSGSGLLGTPEAALAIACMRYWLDPGDSLAAAEVVALESLHSTEGWLERRLEFVRDLEGAEAASPWVLESSPALVAIRGSVEGAADKAGISPLDAFDVATGSADVGRIISLWGQSEERSRQRVANLAGVRGLIADYEKRCAEFGVPATPNGLFGWLDDVAEGGEDKLPRDETGAAIHVGTYHSAKGLEWPVVFLADLEATRWGQLFDLRVVAPESGVVDFDNPLSGRELRRWIDPFGGKYSEHPLIEGLEDTDEGRAAEEREAGEMLRLLYVGFTRARDRLILLKEEGKHPAWLDELGESAATELASPSGGIAVSGGDPIPASTRIHEFRGDEGSPPVPDVLDLPVRMSAATPRIPAFTPPSGQTPVEGARVVAIHEYGERMKWKGHPNERDLGDAFHRILAAEILRRKAPRRENRTRAILSAFELTGSIDTDAVLGAVDKYLAFVDLHFRPTAHRSEVPFTVTNAAGQTVTGFIDHLLDTPDGQIIIDHKIFPGKRSDWEDVALGYSGQLAAYADSVGSSPRNWIHLATQGAMLELGD